jgi:superfamily I DNA/RNA helicase
VQVRLRNLAQGDPVLQGLSAAGLVAYEYFARMRHSGSLSFDAIISFAHATLKAVESYTDVEELLVDEIQDCSDIEFELFMAHPGSKFFVGDVDQSVFGFKGANPGNVINLWKAWGGY